MKYILVIFIFISYTVSAELREITIEKESRKKEQQLRFQEFLKTVQVYKCSTGNKYYDDVYYIFIKGDEAAVSYRIYKFDESIMDDVHKLYFNGSKNKDMVSFKSRERCIENDFEFYFSEKKLYRAGCNEYTSNIGDVSILKCESIRK